ncbi:MAG TPA: malto-oligosyltrehalose synthase [Verrucomicrobiae bacterium]
MKSSGSILRVPSATYRLQFNAGYTFQQAAVLVDYLHELGITDCYCSPLFAAPPDSNHGYDVCDFTVLNPVLGSEKDWNDFVTKTQAKGMGLLVDFVPNHMGAIPQYNHWWADVLENGAQSPYATYFDIDWKAPHLPVKDRLLLPILGDHYGKCLERGDINLVYEAGRFQIAIGDLRLPVSLSSHRLILESTLPVLESRCRRRMEGILNLLPWEGEIIKPARISEAKRRLAELAEDECYNAFLIHHAASFGANDDKGGLERLHELLEQQSYRLVYWHSGTRTANYRRFFDVDSLAALRMELPEVFAATHRLLLKLIGEGQVTGLRLDHVDGLASPEEYLRRLQAAIAQAKGVTEASDGRPFYVLVEKITMVDEPLRSTWPVAGTSGYEFAREVTGVLVQKENETQIDRIYRGFTGRVQPFAEGVRDAKKLVMGLAMSKEISGLSRLLQKCAEQRPVARDILYEDLQAAVRETMAAMKVYRTYCVPGQTVTNEDRKIITEAIKTARSANPELEPMAWEFLQQVLLGDAALGGSPTEQERLFARRFQQTTGAVMAKGFEDTVFYVFNRLNALNEVGGKPDNFGLSVAEFHRLNGERLRSWPYTMVTTSTHDTKVSEDVRARLAVISELPEEWERFLSEASKLNRSCKQEIAGHLAPDANEEYLFYQMLLGTWPLENFTAESRKEYCERLNAYMTKALNEAKVNTRWDKRNEAWEQATMDFIEALVIGKNPVFTKLFSEFSSRIAEWGAVNSLSQLLLKMTVPGVPDFYQGNELWQFILVDPDNRRQIDYNLRQRMMAEINGQGAAELFANWRTGGIKMFLTKTVLRFRREHQELFDKGDYQPMRCEGKFADSCLSFTRVYGEKKLVVLTTRVGMPIGYPPTGKEWENTSVDLAGLGSAGFRDLLTGSELKGGKIGLAEVFHTLPFAVLYADA